MSAHDIDGISDLPIISKMYFPLPQCTHALFESFSITIEVFAGVARLNGSSQSTSVTEKSASAFSRTPEVAECDQHSFKSHSGSSQLLPVSSEPLSAS